MIKIDELRITKKDRNNDDVFGVVVEGMNCTETSCELIFDEKEIDKETFNKILEILGTKINE